MRLIHKPASNRDVTEGRIRLKHVLSRQFDATPDDKRVRGVSECVPEGARKVRRAALYERAKICDEYTTGNMPVDMIQYLASLPCQQTLFSIVRTLLRGLRIHLPAQQGGCFEYRPVRRLFMVQLTDGRIQQGDDMVHPVGRSTLTDTRTHGVMGELSLHAGDFLDRPFAVLASARPLR
jgi:hypothetical protein